MKIIGPVDAVFEEEVAELETIISTEMVYDLAIGTGYIGSTMHMLFEEAWKGGIKN